MPVQNTGSRTHIPLLYSEQFMALDNLYWDLLDLQQLGVGTIGKGILKYLAS